MPRRVTIFLQIALAAVAACADQRAVQEIEKTTPIRVCPADHASAGWIILEDVPSSEFQVTDLEFIPFLKPSEQFVSGVELRRRAFDLKANLGLADAEVLRDHQDKIPQDLQSKDIFFPGTLRRTAEGIRQIPYLHWRGRWCLHWSDIDFALDTGDRLPRRK